MNTFSVAYSFILVVLVMEPRASMLSMHIAAVQDVCETIYFMLELDNLKRLYLLLCHFYLPLNSRSVVHFGDLELWPSSCRMHSGNL